MDQPRDRARLVQLNNGLNGRTYWVNPAYIIYVLAEPESGNVQIMPNSRNAINVSLEEAAPLLEHLSRPREEATGE